jgi:hypothetical protein
VEKQVDIRNIFKATSEQLLSEFRKTAEIKHSGGKGDLREDAFRVFLNNYLPKRYAVGRGEVITPENRVSGELDIVIYDPNHCPALITSSSHSVYPIESVYGAISMKSHLDSNELEDAYNNIASLKKILIRQSFTHYPSAGMAIGMGCPIPVTGIIAYDANRSLDAISNQAKDLDSKLSDITLRPDFIAVIGQGIIAPREPLRGDFNHYKLSDDMNKLVELRKTGRHTLLRLYMQILRELNALTLRPLDLQDYDNMPRIVGPYRVKKHDRFVRTPIDGSSQGQVSRLNKAAIDEIVNKSKLVTLKQHYLNHLGQLPLGIEQLKNLEDSIYEYNPKTLPPISSSDLKKDQNGRPYFSSPVFIPVYLQIDGKQYAADLSSLSESHFEEDNDFTIDELMSI